MILLKFSEFTKFHEIHVNLVGVKGAAPVLHKLPETDPDLREERPNRCWPPPIRRGGGGDRRILSDHLARASASPTFSPMARKREKCEI